MPAVPFQLYGRDAHWWPVLSPVADYAEEAAFFYRLLCGHPLDAPARPRPRVLELGCGGGHLASHLAPAARLVLTDLSAEMLELSRRLNPEAEHVQGDMRSLRLGRSFDAVLVHDAASHLCDGQSLRAALDTAYAHCCPGGVTVFAPDYVRETFEESVEHGGSPQRPEPDVPVLRYTAWVHDPDPEDSTYVVDYAILTRRPGAEVQVAHERHVEGLFTRATWLDAMRVAGFEPRCVPFEHSEADPAERIFVGRRPS